MTYLYEIVKNIILILFPFLCYIIYIAYCNDINKKESSLILSLTLFISMYISYAGSVNSTYPMLMINIPLIIAYIKRKRESVFFISLLIVLIYSNNYNIHMAELLLEYSLYYILLGLIIKSKKSTPYIIIFCSIKIVIYTTELVLIQSTISLEILLEILTFIPSCILIIQLIDKSDNIINLNISIKELEKEKQLRNSLFNIAHEIKNPLAVCKGYLEMFDIKNHNHEKYIPIIQNELNRSITLMNDMLNLNNIKINPDYMDINLLLEDINMCIKPLVGSKNVVININLSKEEMFVYADYTRLKHVFIDIIKNSVDSLSNKHDKRIINIDVTLKNNKIITTIKDNAIVSKNELNDLSDIYYIPNSKNKSLGITLAQQIIKCHNGKLEFLTKSKKGNITRIILPAA